jgi:hypothetical protein
MSSEPISSYQPSPPYQPMEQPNQPMGEVADMLNTQLATQVDPNSFVDPHTVNQKMMMPQPTTSDIKFPEFLKEPALVFALVMLFSYPIIRNNISKYIPQIGTSDSRSTVTNSLILSLFVAVTFGLIKKFLLKN